MLSWNEIDSAAELSLFRDLAKKIELSFLEQAKLWHALDSEKISAFVDREFKCVTRQSS